MSSSQRTITGTRSSWWVRGWAFLKRRAAFRCGRAGGENGARDRPRIQGRQYDDLLRKLSADLQAWGRAEKSAVQQNIELFLLRRAVQWRICKALRIHLCKALRWRHWRFCQTYKSVCHHFYVMIKKMGWEKMESKGGKNTSHGKDMLRMFNVDVAVAELVIVLCFYNREIFPPWTRGRCARL